MASVSHTRRTRFRRASVLGFLLLVAAVISLAYSGLVPSIAFLFAAVMSWSRMFEENSAKGRPTLSAGGRFAVGAGFTAIGALFLWLPGKMAVGIQPGEALALSESEAAPICEEAARDRITHPSTADFSILGTGFKSFDDDTAIFTTTFTARNAFNLELEYQVACDFTGSALTGIKIIEAR